MSERMFARASEADVTRAIVSEFSRWFESCVRTDAVVVGAGPSGLVAARELARSGWKVLLIERNNYLGGGFWIGGYLMNKLTVRAPAHEQLARLNVPLKEFSPGLYVADGPHACAALIASACEAGVNVLNMTTVDDVVLRGGRVEGVVVNWTPVGALPRQITCVDPVALETSVVIDATGHEAAVAGHLARRGLLEQAGMGPMDVESSEEGVVAGTGEVFDGLICAGMSVSTVRGVPRMGPTFGAMLASGVKAAVAAEDVIARRLVESRPAEAARAEEPVAVAAAAGPI